MTAESKMFIEHYYPTKAKERILTKLRYGKNNLIGLIGLQGTGKTTLLLYLANHAETTNHPAKYIKWTRDWTKKAMEYLERYHDVLRGELVELFHAYGQAQKPFPGLGCVPHFGHIADVKDGRYDSGSLELMLGTRRVKEIKEQLLIEELQDLDFIFIDLPDYTKTDRRMMAADLEEVQQLWQKIQVEGEGVNVSFVIAIQKELFKGHFFFGKLDVVEIDLLEPNSLVEAYKKYWKEPYPFTEEALVLVAEYSRGVFRRFLKYLRLCLEHARLKAPITVETVKSAITLEQQLQDMDLELTDVFSNKEQKVNAVKILNSLREKERSQKELAEILGVDEMAISRLVRKLEAYNYIQRKRDAHGRWLITFKQ